MKIDLFICSKPLQYLNICNIKKQNNLHKKYLLIIAAFYNSREFVDNLKLTDKEWDKIIYCDNYFWIFYVLFYNVKNLYFGIDSTIVGVLHFIKRFNFYLYEEGAGTYRKLFIQKKYFFLAKFLGTGKQMGHSKYLKGVFVYYPDFYKEQIRPLCPVYKFELSNRDIIKKKSELFFMLYPDGLLENVMVSNKKILLYLTDWNYDIAIIEKISEIKNKYDIVFIKPHPHRKKEDLPVISGVVPIYSSILAELLLSFWLENNNKITVIHQNSTAVIPFGEFIEIHNMDDKEDNKYYREIINNLCSLASSNT